MAFTDDIREQININHGTSAKRYYYKIYIVIVEKMDGKKGRNALLKTQTTEEPKSRPM